jgi:hypothetical protein
VSLALLGHRVSSGFGWVRGIKYYLGSQFERMQPLTSLSATPSRNLGCGFKSTTLQLYNSTS